MKSIILNLNIRRNPLCPVCYVPLATENIFLFKAIACCSECVIKDISSIKTQVAEAFHSYLPPQHKAFCRGVHFYVPEYIPTIALHLELAPERNDDDTGEDPYADHPLLPGIPGHITMHPDSPT